MSKINIRFSSVCLGGGGAEHVLHDLINNISKDKFDVTLFLFERSGSYLESLSSNINIKYFIDPKWFKHCKWLYDKVIRRLMFRVLMMFPSFVYWITDCKHCDVDIAFIQDMTYLLKANYADKKIAWIHTNIEFSPTFHAGLNKNLAYADIIVGVSDGVTNGVKKHYPKLSAQFITINNPSDITLIKHKSLVNVLKYDKPTVLAVGRFKPQKDYLTLINAFNVVIKKGYDWELIILGDGELYKTYSQLIVDLGLTNKVKLLGFKENPYQYMRMANLFVLSSICEGFGQVIVEALALKLPVVSTDCDFGPREILQNGKYGSLVPIQDHEALAIEIEKTLQSSQLELKLRIDAGYARALEFDVPHIVAIIENMILSLNN